jgi:DNA-binding response OmpR family regulator
MVASRQIDDRRFSRVQKKIAIIEDDTDTRRMLVHVLENEGYQTSAFAGAREALGALADIQPDLALIDLTMPEMDGVDLSRQLRAQPQFDRMPILILTAQDHVINRYEAFAVGVNDYITKPFDPIELIYRVRAFLRLVGNRSSNEPLGALEVGGLRLEPARFIVTVRGDEITLTKIETTILHFLMSRPGEVFSAGQLSSSVMGEGGRSVDAAHAHIRHLRQKLEIDPKVPKIIVTLGRKGYYFAK